MSRHSRRAQEAIQGRAGVQRQSGLIVPPRYGEAVVPAAATPPQAPEDPPIGTISHLPRVCDPNGGPAVLVARPDPRCSGTFGTGILIFWHAGGRPGTVDEAGQPVHRTGAYVEDVLLAARGRLEAFQAGSAPSVHNDRAIAAIDDALEALRDRRAEVDPEGVRAEEEALARADLPSQEPDGGPIASPTCSDDI